MSGMQVDTVKKVVSNSSGASGVSLSTLRRAEDDDSDAPMKRELIAFRQAIGLRSLHCFAVPEVGNNLRIAIQQARQAKGWTQKELAQKLNEPAQIVNQCVQAFVGQGACSCSLSVQV